MQRSMQPRCENNHGCPRGFWTACRVPSQLAIPANSAAGISLAAVLQGPKEAGPRIFSRCCSAPSEELAEENQRHKVSNIYYFISGYFTHNITKIYIYPEYFIDSSIPRKVSKNLKGFFSTYSLMQKGRMQNTEKNRECNYPSASYLELQFPEAYFYFLNSLQTQEKQKSGSCYFFNKY